MKRINKNLYPSGGYFFKESDGARIFGDSWAGVIARVEKYRQRAKMERGNPEEEVIAQACQRNPALCYEVDHATTRARVIASLKSRVLRWLAELRQGSTPEARIFTTEEERKRRVGICAPCRNNQPLPGGCASCKAALAELRQAVMGKRPIDGRLNACAVLGEDLGTSSNLEQPAVENVELPAECWRKKTL